MTRPAESDPWNAATPDEINAVGHVVGNQYQAETFAYLPIALARSISKAAINAFLCLRRPAPSAPAMGDVDVVNEVGYLVDCWLGSEGVPLLGLQQTNRLRERIVEYARSRAAALAAMQADPGVG